MAELRWMRHREHGGVAELPATAAWEALGWEPCEPPPPDPDPALVEHVPAPAALDTSEDPGEAAADDDTEAAPPADTKSRKKPAEGGVSTDG